MTHTVMVMDQARKVTWELPVPPPLLAFPCSAFHCNPRGSEDGVQGWTRCYPLGACVKLCWEAGQLHESRGPKSIRMALGVHSATVSRHDRPEMAEQSEPPSPPQARHTHPGLGFRLQD